MNLSEVKKILKEIDTISFELENGARVPEHFHVTEVGVITKNFIDCGGMVRNESVANFQLWDANDFEHRLKPGKLLNIIALSEQKLNIGNLEIEVEYQGNTIEKYDLDFNGKKFVLVAKKTNCLALDKCGTSFNAKKKSADLKNESNCCIDNSNCC